MKIFKSWNFLLNPNVLISSHVAKHDIFSFGNVFKPYHVNLFWARNFMNFRLSKMRFSVSKAYVFFKLKILKSIYLLNDDNGTGAQHLKPFRIIFTNFNFQHFELWKMCLQKIVKMRCLPEKHFSLKMKIFESWNFSYLSKDESFLFGQIL